MALLVNKSSWLEQSCYRVTKGIFLLNYIEINLVVSDMKTFRKKISPNPWWPYFYTPPHDSGGVLWYHVGYPCVCPSAIRPSVFSFPDNNLSKCQWIFTKLGVCIDIVEIWFGIVNGQISLTFDSVICPRYVCIFISG